MMKRLLLDYVRSFTIFVLASIGACAVIMLVLPRFGYLTYSDRPGPGWYGGLDFRWDSVRHDAGMALGLAVFALPAAVILFPLSFAGVRLSEVHGLARTPRAIMGAALCAGLAFITLAGAGWIVSLGWVPLLAGLAGAATYGAAVLSRKSVPLERPRILWLVALAPLVLLLLFRMGTADSHAGRFAPRGLVISPKSSGSMMAQVELGTSAATNAKAYPVLLPPGLCHLSGGISASKATLFGLPFGSKTFEAFLLDDANARERSEGHAFQSVWSSGRVTTTRFDTLLAGPSNYRLVMSNSFSRLVHKALTIQLQASCR
jgi:hypothetical protein